MLGLVIPSVYTRIEFLKRCLVHIQRIGFNGPIVISDHSPTEDRKTISECVQANSQLNIQLIQHSENLHFLERITDAAKHLDTPYVMLHADDDFFFPDTANECCNLLQQDSTYSAARGRMIFFNIDQQQNMGLFPHEGRQRREENSQERVIKHIENFFPTLYAVHRRDSFINAYETCLKYTQNVIFWQYLSSCLTIQQGKVATLEGLQYARYHNPKGWRAGLQESRDKEHWPYLYFSPNFSQYMSEFMKGLQDCCSFNNNDMLKIEEACLHLLRRSMGVNSPEGKDPGDTQLEQSFGDEDSLATKKMNYVLSLF